MPASNDTNLLQMLATQIHTLLVLTVAREKHSKNYLDLEPQQRDEVEGIVAGMIRHYWNYYAPENLLGMAQGAKSDSVQ
jgi:hypothetical protein